MHHSVCPHAMFISFLKTDCVCFLSNTWDPINVGPIGVVGVSCIACIDWIVLNLVGDNHKDKIYEDREHNPGQVANTVGVGFK